MVGELLDGAGGRVGAVEVEPIVAVGDEVDGVADPHRVALGARAVCDRRHRRRVEIKKIQILRPAALIALPVPEVAEQRRVDDAIAVG